jgi:cytoskeletal protein CcmA (bactofilin family)
MFQKNNPPRTSGSRTSGNVSVPKKEHIPSVIAQDIHMLGNVVSEGMVDFDGKLDGNIRCDSLVVRNNAFVKGEILANSVSVYGKVKGLIRAKSVHLYASCHVEGIIMHEALTIEDGAYLDGKCKRTDKIETEDDSEFTFEDTSSDGSKETKILENIRLIR